MRITQQVIHQNSLRALQQQLAALASAQNQSSTGRRINTVSDDPVDASSIMGLNSKIAATDQYRRNGLAATSKLSAEDTVLTSVRKLISTAKDLAAGQYSPDITDSVRTSALIEVRALRQQLVALGNTKVGHDYIFSGTDTTTPSFTATGTYMGNTGVLQAMVTDSESVDLNHAGNTFLAGTFQSLDDLETALQTGTPDQIKAVANTLDGWGQQALEAQTEIGIRLQQVNDAGTRAMTDMASFKDQRDALQNADPTEAAANLLSSQTALEQAYAAVGRVLSVNLLDYLR